MFKEKFIQLCNKKGESPSSVCRKVGVTPATFSCWTDISVPRKATLMRIADYFNVPVDYLLGKEDGEPLTLTDEENELVTKYRAAGEETRTAVKKILDIPMPSIADDIADTVARFSPVSTEVK